MAELSDRVRLYKKIEDNLSDDDVRSLKAMLVADGHLGQARIGNQTPLDIFNMLEVDNKIGKGNLALLVELLKALGKTKLAQEAGDVAKREGTARPPYTVVDVISSLKGLYATEYANVRPLPWCEDLNLALGEVYTNLQYQHRDDRGRFEDTETIVSLEDIYKTSKATPKNVSALSAVKRIRVEGDPGIGKSCSCQKLAHDWSSGKLDVFKAVFFLEIRHMSGKVKDAIFEQLLPEDANMTPDQLWSYIQENQDDVLFILDGLDELSQTARESTDVVALIQGKILRDCHVLVTSRPYHCVKDLEKCHEFYKIVGYREDDSVRFIQKYFRENHESARKLVEQLKSNRNLSRIIVNPLNNVLICIVWEDNEGSLPSSLAELYQMIVYSVAKRHCSKIAIPFGGDRFPSNIEETLRCLGKLSWEGLEQDQLQFNIDDIKEKYGHNADDMLVIGLLTRDNSFSRIKRTCFCAFLHKTFQEYMAAYYISESVKQESRLKEGIKCLCSLFGMTKTAASDVDLELMSSNRRRYREVQNMLLAILGYNSGPLFEIFAEYLNKDGCKGKDRDLLSFICVMFLGRTCGAGRKQCRMVEIVAPCLSQHVTNDVSKQSADDHAKWIDGLIQVIRCQGTLAMNHDPRSIRHLTVDLDNIKHMKLQQQQLDMLENALQNCDAISCVTLLQAEPAAFVNVTGDLGHETVPIRTFIPRCGAENVHIDFKYIDRMGLLKELSEIQSLQHVNISIGFNNINGDYSDYDSLLAAMLMKQSCLRSISVTIGEWACKPKGTKSFGNLTATLHSISEHATLEVVELEHPVYNELSDSSADKCERPVTFDVKAMVRKLTECVTKNKFLKRLRLSWKTVEHYVFSITPPTVYKGICSSQSLSDLCLAIQGNRTLETLTIDGMFSESEGHQETIDLLLRNKPENFNELRITMLKSKQYDQQISTDSPSCSSDFTSHEQRQVNPAASAGAIEQRYNLRPRCSSQRCGAGKRSRRSQSL
ncbi:uncharacterized protein LOC144879269 [Branchiostoma floridae x Branchiostoma japonicum]